MKRYIRADIVDVNDEDEDFRWDLSRDADASPRALAHIADDPDFLVRGQVARNPNTPPEVLLKLADDNISHVCAAVATNPNAPLAALEKLSRWAIINGTYNMSEDIIRHPNATAELINSFADSINGDVRALVAESPMAYPETLAKLAERAKKSWSAAVTVRVAGNPNTPVDTLAWLSDDTNVDTKYYVAKNPSTDVSTLRKLVDFGGHVSHEAKKNLRSRGIEL